MSDPFIYPDWPAPKNIHALSSTRQGGFSLPPFDKLNLATHVGDNEGAVNHNRATLSLLAHLPATPLWLDQVHDNHAINSVDWQSDIEADAIFSRQTSHVCTILTADCLPILLCNKQGDTVAAIHAGWRSLATGIIEQTLMAFECEPHDIMAWFGPAIGPTKFEVGTDVFDTFCQHSIDARHAFTATDASHYLADLYSLAKLRLSKQGISAVFGGHFCTVTNEQRFFSYRRDGHTGRMATMIWIADK